MYFRESSGAMIVCNASNPRDLEMAPEWKSCVSRYLDGIPVILLINTMNVESWENEKSEEIDRFCTENGFTAWFKVSPKAKEACDKAVLALINVIVSNELNGNADESLPIDPTPSSKCLCQ